MRQDKRKLEKFLSKQERVQTVAKKELLKNPLAILPGIAQNTPVSIPLTELEKLDNQGQSSVYHHRK